MSEDDAIFNDWLNSLENQSTPTPSFSPTSYNDNFFPQSSQPSTNHQYPHPISNDSPTLTTPPNTQTPSYKAKEFLALIIEQKIPADKNYEVKFKKDPGEKGKQYLTVKSKKGGRCYVNIKKESEESFLWLNTNGYTQEGLLKITPTQSQLDAIQNKFQTIGAKNFRELNSVKELEAELLRISELIKKPQKPPVRGIAANSDVQKNSKGAKSSEKIPFDDHLRDLEQRVTALEYLFRSLNTRTAGDSHDDHFLQNSGTIHQDLENIKKELKNVGNESNKQTGYTIYEQLEAINQRVNEVEQILKEKEDNPRRKRAKHNDFYHWASPNTEKDAEKMLEIIKAIENRRWERIIYVWYENEEGAKYSFDNEEVKKRISRAVITSVIHAGVGTPGNISVLAEKGDWALVRVEILTAGYSNIGVVVGKALDDLKKMHPDDPLIQCALSCISDTDENQTVMHFNDPEGRAVVLNHADVLKHNASQYALGGVQGIVPEGQITNLDAGNLLVVTVWHDSTFLGANSTQNIFSFYKETGKNANDILGLAQDAREAEKEKSKEKRFDEMQEKISGIVVKMEGMEEDIKSLKGDNECLKARLGTMEQMEQKINYLEEENKRIMAKMDAFLEAQAAYQTRSLPARSFKQATSENIKKKQEQLIQGSKNRNRKDQEGPFINLAMSATPGEAGEARKERIKKARSASDKGGNACNRKSHSSSNALPPSEGGKNPAPLLEANFNTSCHSAPSTPFTSIDDLIHQFNKTPFLSPVPNEEIKIGNKHPPLTPLATLDNPFHLKSPTPTPTAPPPTAPTPPATKTLLVVQIDNQSNAPPTRTPVDKVDNLSNIEITTPIANACNMDLITTPSGEDSNGEGSTSSIEGAIGDNTSGSYNGTTSIPAYDILQYVSVADPEKIEILQQAVKELTIKNSADKQKYVTGLLQEEEKAHKPYKIIIEWIISRIKPKIETPISTQLLRGGPGRKRGEKDSAGFQERYFLLTKDYKLIYIDPNNLNPKGMIDMAQVDSVQPSEKYPNANCLELDTVNRVYYLQFKKQVIDGWWSDLHNYVNDRKKRK